MQPSMVVLLCEVFLHSQVGANETVYQLSVCAGSKTAYRQALNVRYFFLIFFFKNADTIQPIFDHHTNFLYGILIIWQ